MTDSELIAVLDARFDRIDARFDRIDARFGAFDVRFQYLGIEIVELASDMKLVKELLGAVDDKVERLALNTQEQFSEVHHRLDAIESLKN